MDYSKLSDQEINGLVMDTISDGNQAHRSGDGSAIELLHQINTVEFGEHVEREEVYAKFDPCNNPADAWPIIVGNGISLIKCTVGSGYWSAEIITDIDEVTDKLFQCQSSFDSQDANPLRAAMIVFLMMQESANVQDNPARNLLR